MNEFTTVDQLKQYCYKVLPLVYDDSLSYYEVLSKVTNTLNEVINNTNHLPEYIANLIKNYITVGAVDEVVRDILANYILNVKYPPQGLPSAVGDGSADDTDAIQGCIDYAAQHGGGLVYIPYGKYLVNSLTMKSGVGIKGFDRHSTELVLAGGAETALLCGDCSNVSLVGLTLNANSGNQVNEVDCINVTGGDYLFSDLVLTNGYNLITINGDNGVLQCANVVCLNTVHRCLSVTGDITVQLCNCSFNNLSSVAGECVMYIGASNGNYEFTSTANTQTVAMVTGDNNTLRGVVTNCLPAGKQGISPVEDTGSNNTYEFAGLSESHTFADTSITNAKSVAYQVTNDYLLNCAQFTVNTDNYALSTRDMVGTIIGDMNINIDGLHIVQSNGGKRCEIKGNSIEQVAGDKTVTVDGEFSANASSISETCTNKKEVSCAELTETVTGNVSRSASSLSETVEGDKIVTVDGEFSANASSISETCTNKKEVSCAELTETVTGNVSRSASSLSETVEGDKIVTNLNNIVNCERATINTNDIYVNSTNPIRYGSLIAGTYFDKLTMIDKDGNNYELLAENDNTSKLGASGEMAHVLDGQRQYIDQVNGDDSNDGTEQRPWKSLAPFFAQANSTKSGKVDIRCYIVSSGTYTIPPQSYNNLTIHITGSVDGVILNFETPRDVKFYECHTNFKNVTISAPNATEFAFDGGSISCHNCTFTHTLTTYACMGYLYKCNIKNLDAQTSTLIINGCNLTNTDPALNGWEFHSCLVRFQGSSQNASLTADGDDNSFIYAVGSYIVYGITYRLTDYRYKYGLTTVASYITTNLTQYNNLKDRSVSGVTASEFGSLIILSDGLNEVNAGTLGGNVRYSNGAMQYYNGSAWVTVPST